MLKLKDYKPVVGSKLVDQIRHEAEPLIGKHVVHFNSTFYGGGVAEMLNSLVPLFNSMKIETGWRLLKGSPDFFGITKKFHNAMQGDKIHLTFKKKKVFENTNELNASFTHIAHDCVIVHDPQPLPLIKFYKKTQPWIWRCHIDASHPNKQLWAYLRKFLSKYDKAIFSKSSFIQKDLPCSSEIIYPAIDPLTTKNKPLSDSKVHKYLRRHGIDANRPIISQVARFDKWKDQISTIKAFKLIKEKCNCQLVLLGSAATDDPEGQEVYQQILELTKGQKDIHVINFQSDILVNAVQTASAVNVEKSIKEGFGLSVTESMWKEVPVIAGNVGGISLQIKDKINGFLVNNAEAIAKRALFLLNNPKKRREMGKKAKATVKEKFLITRQVRDYVKLLKKQMLYYKPSDGKACEHTIGKV